MAKGLNIEENLLFEKKHSLDCDIKDIDTSNIGIETRSDLDLPNIAESEVVRHFVRLSQKNYSIDTGFYPLGSCTMKHNPRLNEKVARLDGFADLHPMQPSSTSQGALELMYELQDWLSELSGLPAISLNPAAGAHGEMAGIMIVKKYHDINSNNKKYIIVPDSAHGTNPATAKMCGYDIKTVPSTKDGTVDIDKFKELVDGDVAGMMITNPNTCGIFEYQIDVIADILHKHDALLYCDGANFNAIMGKAKPGEFGVDVMHFNLHKTFSTPHGGGGPGSGPIAVTEKLRSYLPLPVVDKEDDSYILNHDVKHSIGRIKGFQGHFGMFVRALSYMKSLGKDGLKQASEDAVLNANYILHHLKNDFDVPFDNFCMHECLLTDKFQKKYDVTTHDIAKTLIEEGMHPMTVYFPLIVQGAMLIEPTETETKESIDHFIEVMKKIANIARNDSGSLKNNPVSTPRKRLDEVKAARNPILTFDEINQV